MSGAVFAVVVYRRDVHVFWCLVGSIINSFLSKVGKRGPAGGKGKKEKEEEAECVFVVAQILKRIINQARPPSARKLDPGMPSSHAQSLGYFGTYAAVKVATAGPSEAAMAIKVLLAASSIGAALFLTWLRVVLGYHTVPQIAVGYSIGALLSLAWIPLGDRVVFPRLGQGGAPNNSSTFDINMQRDVRHFQSVVHCAPQMHSFSLGGWRRSQVQHLWL